MSLKVGVLEELEMAIIYYWHRLGFVFLRFTVLLKKIHFTFFFIDCHIVIFLIKITVIQIGFWYQKIGKKSYSKLK